jgi:hypothetical protein
MVNSRYLQQKTFTQIRQLFNAQQKLPSIQLPDFFTQAEYKDLKQQVLQLKFKKIYDPVKYRMEFVPVTKVTPSADVLKLLSAVIGKKISSLRLQGFSFKHKDYTLICEEDGARPGIDIMIDFSDDLDASAGGSTVYVDGTGEYFKIPPKANSLTIIKRPKKNMRKFVQYLNVLSKKKKRLFLFATI